MLYDNEPNKIQKEITNRDVFGVSDHFQCLYGFDGQQDFRFFVSAANIQMDCLATEGTKIFPGCDMGSKATITDFGWVVEMKTMRFSNAKKQTWDCLCVK
jgi:hypothetical protein